MRNLVTAIQNRDGKSLQQMYSAEKPKQKVPEQAVQIFNELFRQLKAAFPALMATIKEQDELNELRRQWVMAFMENGITSMEQVNAGMKIARQQSTPFLPSPGQFVTWCKDSAIRASGLPDEDELYSMFKLYCRDRGMYDSSEKYPWKSAPCFHMVTAVYNQMRSFNLSDSEVRKRCVEELRKMSRRIEAGESIPEPRPQLPHLHCPTGNEKALNHLADIRKKLNLPRRS